MIVLDASAILAVLLIEPEREMMLAALEAAGGGVISPVNWWEVTVRARALRGDRGLQQVTDLLQTMRVHISPTDEAQTRAAFNAHVRFGRGTAAALNLGDCFAYALAKQEGDGLLFKGEDFPKTDVRSAIPPTGR